MNICGTILEEVINILVAVSLPKILSSLHFVSMTPSARMCSTAALCAVICVAAPVFLQFAAPTRGLRGATGATGATPTAPTFGSTVGILGTTMAVGAVAAVARASKVDGGRVMALPRYLFQFFHML